MKFFICFPVLALFFSCAHEHIPNRPNVIMIMCDDLGWGDTGFNGNEIIKTPNLDLLASKGMVFNRFYSASPVCSPTRASCLTGRNPYRMDIPNANSGHMKMEEVTLAEILRKHKYKTGHFGKWHLGTLTTRIKDANRGKPGVSEHFSIPTQHGFDEFFSTESKVPTYDPMNKPKIYNEKIGESPRYGWAHIENEEDAEPFGTYYWNGKEMLVEQNLGGDDSKLIMDKAIDFIQSSNKSGNPFFCVIWMHTPHLPVVADKTYRNLYKDLDFQEQLYYGTITAMDEQVGRLWKTLNELEE
ncbi:MAG: sulfatase-like hydrolase/transferase, partial [Cyclobacteriaceae bacterium]|nr:sulfatase-like hydrolase/transferase [Cyclobacteriaceae bacterium]